MSTKWMDDLIAEGWTISEAQYDFPDGSRAKAFMIEKGDRRIIIRADMRIEKGKGGLGIGFRVELPIIEVRDERGLWRQQEEE